MKIAILTLPLGHNYGGILQAFALQNVLEKMGHSVLIINRRSRTKNNLFFKVLSVIKRLFLNIVGIKIEIRTWLTKKEKEKIYKNLYDFISKKLNLSKEINSSSELKKIVSEYNFDVIIVGSDQVWRAEYSPSLDNFFLDFVTDNIKKISYAASFGVDTWTYNYKQTLKYSILIKKFNAISVREESGVELCKNYLGVKAEHSLDPTMLLSKEDYMGLIKKDKLNFENTNNLLVYILDNSEEKDKIVEEASNKLNAKPYYLACKKNIFGPKEKIIENPTISDWLYSFLIAKFIITDSFHGVIFSVIFNKPFIVIPNIERGEARFTSLLKMFDLEKTIFNRNKDKVDDKIEQKIDFIKVNNKIDEMRLNSLKFLEKNLS